jgi:hypothetical protein
MGLSQVHFWLFSFWQLAMLVLPLVLLAIFLPCDRVREWFQVSNLSSAAELVIKAGAIVAGVVALNLFQLKPRLTVDERCDAKFNVGQVIVAYGKLKNVPPQIRTTLKLSREKQIGTRPIPLGTGKPGDCGRPRPDLVARGSISVTHLNVIPTATGARVADAQPSQNNPVAVQTQTGVPSPPAGSSSRGSPFQTRASTTQALPHGRRAAPALTLAQLRKASRAISRATTVTVRAFVRNIGRGDATSVKVDQPPGVWLAPDVPRPNSQPDCQTPPFDIAAGEPAKVVCYRTSGRRIAFTSEDFKAFGDAKPKVDDAWLWAIAGALYVLVLGAIVSEIISRRWQPEQQDGGSGQRNGGALHQLAPGSVKLGDLPPRTG